MILETKNTNRFSKADVYILKELEKDNALVVGCSDGNLSISLAKEGFNIVGIDNNKSKILKAEENLLSEMFYVQRKIQFVQEDLNELEISDKFDNIILDDIINKYLKPERVLLKANELLSDYGRILITSEFGVTSGKKDNLQVFYYTDIIKYIIPYFTIEKIEIIENKIIVSARKKQFQHTDEFQITVDDMRKLEEAIYYKEIHKGKENTIKHFKEENNFFKNLLINEKEEKIKYMELVKEVYSKNEEKLKDTTVKENDKIKLEIAKQTQNYKNEEKKLKDIIVKEKEEKIKYMNLLKDSYKNNDKAKLEIAKQKKLYEVLEKRYTALSNSKLGRLTLKIWKKRSQKRK